MFKCVLHIIYIYIYIYMGGTNLFVEKRKLFIFLFNTFGPWGRTNFFYDVERAPLKQNSLRTADKVIAYIYN